MTDNEIIKALEEWIKALKDDYKRLQALDAPMDCFEESHTDKIRVLSNVLDLINRQKAEIERLEKTVDEFKFLESRVNSIKNTPEDTFMGTLLTLAEGVAFYEAVKEVVERLKKSSSTSVVVDSDREIPGTRIYSISEIKLDNLVKEMSEPSLLDKRMQDLQKDARKEVRANGTGED